MKYLVLLLITWNLSETTISSLPASVRKKVNKTLATQYPDAHITLDELKISSNDPDLAYTGGSFHLLNIMNGSVQEGYMTISESNGRFERFTFMTLFNQDLSIRKVQVILYREDYGGEIGHRKWLAQFIGKTSAEELKFQHGIRNISGATLSARSITMSLQELVEGMKRLKKANKI